MINAAHTSLSAAVQSEMYKCDRVDGLHERNLFAVGDRILSDYLP